MGHDDWTARAACRGLDVELFYSTEETDVRAAVKVCRSCPVRGQCLATAVSAGEMFGVWGGVAEAQRRRIVRREQRLPAA